METTLEVETAKNRVSGLLSDDNAHYRRTDSFTLYSTLLMVEEVKVTSSGTSLKRVSSGELSVTSRK